MRLSQERKELLQAESRLSRKAERIEQARQQRDLASRLVQELPEVLPSLTREEKERLIMALICRIDVDRKSKVSITIRLDEKGLRDLPTPLSESSHPPGSRSSTGSRRELLGKPKPWVHARHGQQVKAARCRRNKGYRLG